MFSQSFVIANCKKSNGNNRSYYEESVLMFQISQLSQNMSKTKTNDLMSISELQLHHPQVNWFVFISGILYPAELFTYDDELVVEHAKTLKKVEDLLERTPKR